MKKEIMAITILVILFWMHTLCESEQQKVNQNHKSKIAQFDEIDFDDEDDFEEEYILTELLERLPVNTSNPVIKKLAKNNGGFKC